MTTVYETEMECLEPVKISIVGGTPFIWKAKDVYQIRKEHRIVGMLTGCLPKLPFQNNHLGLPLQLSNEEARLLLDKGYASLQVIDSESVKNRVASPDEICAKHEQLRNSLYAQQNELYKEERRKKIENMADQIVEGKRRRQLEKQQGIKGKKKKRTEAVSSAEQGMEIDIDREAAIKEEMDKVVDIPKDSCSVQLFTESPWHKAENMRVTDFKFPESDHSNIRYQVFTDLWNKGLYITSGSKFGADFLAYPGDPLRYHAHFMIICTGYSEELSSFDLVTLGRLSTQVKKTLVLATVKPDATVDYISFNWAGHNID